MTENEKREIIKELEDVRAAIKNHPFSVELCSCRAKLRDLVIKLKEDTPAKTAIPPSELKFNFGPRAKYVRYDNNAPVLQFHGTDKESLLLGMVSDNIKRLYDWIGEHLRYDAIKKERKWERFHDGDEVKAGYAEQLETDREGQPHIVGIYTEGDHRGLFFARPYSSDKPVLVAYGTMAEAKARCINHDAD